MWVKCSNMGLIYFIRLTTINSYPLHLALPTPGASSPSSSSPSSGRGRVIMNSSCSTGRYIKKTIYGIKVIL